MDRLNKYMELGINKTNKPYIKTFISAILSGIFISFASLTMMIVSANINNISLSRLLSAIVFPIGLILVVMFKTELFTGNILLIIPTIDKKITIKKLLINLIIVYLGNYIGTLIIALLVTNTPIINNFKDNIYIIASNKLSLTTTHAFTLGIMCNILVVSAIYLSTTAKDDKSKIILAYLPVFIFVIMGLEHSIANMYHLNVAYLTKLTNTYTGTIDISNITISNIFKLNLIPVTLGNIIGGLLISLSIYYLEKSTNSNTKDIQYIGD